MRALKAESLLHPSMIRLLTFSSLYPNSVSPNHGIFVETRLRELLKTGEVETRVVSPVPWFFSTHPRFGEYARMAQTPRREEHHGIEVLHPRYFLPPKVGMSVAPLFMALGAIPAIRQLVREGFDFDLIDAHYYYPDGVAAAILAKWFGKPYVVTARGTDLNLIPQYRLPRWMIQWAAQNAQASIGVCSALVDVLRNWGLDPARLYVMRNGVDLTRFHPLPQAEMRRELGVSGSPLLISVGYLIERKGHDIAIDALARLLPTFPEARLLIIGDGPERKNLELLAGKLGVENKVFFTGALPNSELAKWYSAADALVLCSSREGWANVLLESMACGTPVVATSIWGTPEVVNSLTAGRLMAARSATALVESLQDLFANPPPRDEVRRHAECFSWDETSRAQRILFSRIIDSGGA